MTINLSSISRCTNAGHVVVTFTINGGQPRTEIFLTSELTAEPDDIREAAITRLRSAVKEANASTPQQIANALLDKDFKI